MSRSLTQIVTEVMSSFFMKHDCKPTPVQAQPFGNSVKLVSTGPQEYAGILRSPVLVQLLSEQRINLRTMMIPLEQAKGKKGKISSTAAPSLRIVIHGDRREISDLGKALSNEGLYLQPPFCEDIDVDSQYCNPHYLLRPGSQMPMADDLAGGDEDAPSPGTIDERTKSQVMSIFDSADDHAVQPTAKQSPRLRSQLKE